LYDQFNEIKEIGNDCSVTVYSAIWKDGTIYYNCEYEEYTRNSDKEVALKCFNNSQNLIELIINEV